MSTGALRAAPSRADLAAAKNRLMEIEKDFELVSERYNATKERLIAIQAEMGRVRLVVEQIQRRMDSRQAEAVALAQELYKSGGISSAIETVLSSQTIAEIENTLQYLQASENAHAKVFEQLAVDRAALNQHLAVLEEDRARVAATEQRLADLRDEIDAKVADQKDEIHQLTVQIERAERREAARQAALARQQANSAPAPILSVPANPAPAPNGSAQTAVNAALSQVGKPYQWGAAGPNSYDCSGLTMWAWSQAGVSLPHNSGMQYSATARVSSGDWAPGDLLFFGSPIHHVAMYIGNGQMVEAPYTGAYVRVVSAQRSDYVGAGRPGV
ncbi:MAG TPA: NlpC/P60 family protein [Actinomycetota bacterium]|nr:NlpC/P60 family protein [Actinomycetota bacterium]